MLRWLQRLFASSDAPDAAGPAIAVQVARPAPAAKSHLRDEPSVSWMQRSVVEYEFTSWLFDAQNHPDLFTNQTEDAILAELHVIANSPQAGAHLVRRMPGVVPQLLQTLRSPDFSGAELARKIWHDMVLVAEVLRLVNSATFSPVAPINSIDHAILLLGQDGLRQLITGVAFKPIIDFKSGSFTRMVAPRLWEQAERCAVANRLLARDLAISPLDAFVAGLIHNVGLTVSLRVLDRLSDGAQDIGSPTFCNALANYGRTLSHSIGREWHFTDAVMLALSETGSEDEQGESTPLGQVLRMGDYLSKLDMLRRYGRISVDDVRLSHGLSEREIACLAELALEQDYGRSTSGGARA